MSTIKISGKRLELPELARGEQSGWKFEARPGGIWIATHLATGERKRLAVQVRGQEIAFWVGGKLGFAKLESSGRRGGAQSSGSDSDLTAQFPGKVRKLLVQLDAEVAEGDSLLLVEAMKMEFSIKAPFAGRVKKIHVAEGQQLSPGQRFLDLIAVGEKK